MTCNAPADPAEGTPPKPKARYPRGTYQVVDDHEVQKWTEDGWRIVRTFSSVTTEHDEKGNEVVTHRDTKFLLRLDAGSTIRRWARKNRALEERVLKAEKQLAQALALGQRKQQTF